MTVYDLNRDQLIELKQRYITEQYERRGGSPTYGELAEADDRISDSTIYEYYDGYEFVNDDFFCTAGEPEIPKLSDELAEVIVDLMAIRKQGWWAFESPSPSSTESKIKQGINNAIQFLESARRAAIDSHI